MEAIVIHLVAGKSGLKHSQDRGHSSSTIPLQCPWGGGAPLDLSYIKRCAHTIHFSGVHNRRDLVYPRRADISLAQHRDTQVDAFLYENMPKMGKSLNDKPGVSPDWLELTGIVFAIVKQEMPEADGSLPQHIRPEYMRFLLHVLFILGRFAPESRFLLVWSGPKTMSDQAQRAITTRAFREKA